MVYDTRNLYNTYWKVDFINLLAGNLSNGVYVAWI